jgi:uncharacterized membrane protein YhfC
MLTALYVLNFVLMIALPLVLGAFLARRYGVAWRLFFVGAVTFVLSQVGHLPFNVLAFNGVLLPPATSWARPVLAVAAGLSAGVFEEVARYLVYRFWIKDARTWRQAVMFGAGHGGGEAMIIGVLAGLTTLNLLALANRDLNTLGLNPEQLTALQAQLAAFQAGPWYMALLGVAERIFAIIFHISAAVLVLQVFRRRNLLWLAAAILWHTVLNAASLVVLDQAGPMWTEVALGGLSVISLAIIYILRDPPAPAAPAAPPPEPRPEPATSPLTPPPLTAEALKETQYQ